jgi:hypothetical protein
MSPARAGRMFRARNMPLVIFGFLLFSHIHIYGILCLDMGQQQRARFGRRNFYRGNRSRRGKRSEGEAGNDGGVEKTEEGDGAEKGQQVTTS